MQRKEEIKKDEERREGRDREQNCGLPQQRNHVAQDWVPVITDDWVWCSACDAVHPIGSHVR